MDCGWWFPRPPGSSGPRPYCADCGADTARRVRGRGLRFRFGIELSAWESKFESQGRCCAICETTEEPKRGWHTDHDHITGELRAILCFDCNTLVGRWERLARMGFDPGVRVAAYLGTKHDWP